MQFFGSLFKSKAQKEAAGWKKVQIGEEVKQGPGGTERYPIYSELVSPKEANKLILQYPEFNLYEARMLKMATETPNKKVLREKQEQNAAIAAKRERENAAAQKSIARAEEEARIKNARNKAKAAAVLNEEQQIQKELDYCDAFIQTYRPPTATATGGRRTKTKRSKKSARKSKRKTRR